jgi:hypothetical protein
MGDRSGKGKLKLRDAIRLGSLLITYPEAGSTLTCAVGMALLAHGLEPRGAHDYERLMAIYPWLRTHRRRCPRCGVYLRMTGVLAHIFDRHVMKRQITLDWFCEWMAKGEAGAARGFFNRGVRAGFIEITVVRKRGRCCHSAA